LGVSSKVYSSCLWWGSSFSSANKERKSLHDMIAGTVVLYDPNKLLD